MKSANTFNSSNELFYREKFSKESGAETQQIPDISDIFICKN